MTLIGLLTTLVLAVRHQWLAMTSWVAALAGSGVLDLVLKMVIRRPRPPYTFAFPYKHSFSFPSGHANRGLSPCMLGPKLQKQVRELMSLPQS
jgi:membrane-associated phospholipid phosphatase